MESGSFPLHFMLSMLLSLLGPTDQVMPTRFLCFTFPRYYIHIIILNVIKLSTLSLIKTLLWTFWLKKKKKWFGLATFIIPLCVTMELYNIRVHTVSCDVNPYNMMSQTSNYGVPTLDRGPGMCMCM